MDKKTNKLICGECAWYNWTHARCNLHDDHSFSFPINAVIRPLNTDASTCSDRLILVPKPMDKDYDA